jgi:Mlc titration factor MtfA (ptsG expression regulator)
MTLFLMLIVFGAMIYYIFVKNVKQNKRILARPFPESWRTILNGHVKFYYNLDKSLKPDFEKRIQLFLGTKKIEPIDTEIDDSIKIMVAASAIIPMFAFPGYNYPNLREVLIYPNSFDEKFQTQRFDGHEEHIIGMVGNRFMNGTMIISKPDLINAYDGANHNSNVGIHEFVHLIDKVDGETDGIPEILMKHSYVAPWLNIIKEEISRIEKGRSDISPYALKSNAEFLAVVGEYFFDNPEKFERKHPDLYHYLTTIFHQNP